jgi:hypothetical protein
MLYFSKVGIDPDTIDIDQFGKLKQFEEKTHLKGLVESYKKIAEFEDKFARQLELKIRDLQSSDASGENPLSLQFLSVENEELIGSSLNHTFDHPTVNERDFDVVPREKRDELKIVAATAIRDKSYFPVVLAIKNSSASGIRNLYVQLDLSATSNKLEVTDLPLGPFSKWGPLSTSITYYPSSMWGTGSSEILDYVEQKLAKFDSDKLQRIDRDWRLFAEWEALQPQRTRLIKPLFVYSPESANLSIRAKVFADSFPEPLVLEANVRIEAKQSFTDVTNLLPDWEKLLRVSTPERFCSGWPE